MILGLIRFDFLFSEGSAHLKNFSIVVTSLCLVLFIGYSP